MSEKDQRITLAMYYGIGAIAGARTCKGLAYSIFVGVVAGLGLWLLASLVAYLRQWRKAAP